MVASSLYHRKLPTAWLWYSQTRTATPWAWKNMGNSTFHDENVNIWPKTSQNRWWHNGYAEVELDFSDFNFMHYWSGGSFLPDAHSIFSERSWNWNLKRPNSTSACVIIDFGRCWSRFSRFQGEKSNLSYFSMRRGVAGSVSFPKVRNRKKAESGLVPTDL